MFRCSECGNTSQKWQGKCLQCGGWNTFEETVEISKKKWGTPNGKAQEIFSILPGKENIEKIKLKSEELNGVLGDGLTPGSLILLSWEPGIGKSTLALQIADWYAWEKQDAIYISAEENIHQISGRANRLGISNTNIRIFTANILEDILETLERDTSDLVIIDSVSMIGSGNIGSQSGSISQVRYVTEVLMDFSKRTGRSVILIGHVTKEWTISGPKVLEHLVDTVLFLEWSKYENYRILRTLKNRFGPTDEIGLFRMTESGLQDMQNPGTEFVNSENEHLSGSALTLTMEGNRPILIEIEALSTYTKFGYPKRSARGMPAGKVDLLIAVLWKWGDLKLESHDVYVNVARGLSISEPGIDLATIAAIISSKKNLPLGKKIFLGETSLTGVVKNVFGLSKRIDEAIKLGFTEIVFPKNADIKPRKTDGIILHRIAHVNELQKIIG